MRKTNNAHAVSVQLQSHHLRETMIDHIHYVNNLWHISLEVDDKDATAFFKRRKTTLQNELLAEHRNDIKLIIDKDESDKLGYDIYSIQFKRKKGDACHIPFDDIDPDISKQLLKKENK
ncbi:MAG: hypothetical protein EHM85_03440 [Desulfobacteraceae bacterium]|nr:MAG: hypothetical protein EHM85_03440 [Desulfobacteraceae bacterium]